MSKSCDNCDYFWIYKGTLDEGRAQRFLIYNNKQQVLLRIVQIDSIGISELFVTTSVGTVG